MNSIQKAIDKVSSHLDAIGIKLECAINPSVPPREVEAAQKRLGLSFPEAYIQFVTNFSNGLQLSWDAGDDEGASFARFEMATLESSIDGILGMRDWRFYDEAAAENYGFPYVDDSEAALLTNRQMHNWIPFHAEGNGDNFSINLNGDGFGNVIFDQHDWLDGGTGHNGFLIAVDFYNFFDSWAQVCFSQPSGLRWKSVIGENGVDWSSDEFEDRFRLKP